MSDGLIPNSFTLHGITSHASAQRSRRRRQEGNKAGKKRNKKVYKEGKRELSRVSTEINNYSIGTANVHLNQNH